MRDEFKEFIEFKDTSIIVKKKKIIDTKRIKKKYRDKKLEKILNDIKYRRSIQCNQ